MCYYAKYYRRIASGWPPLTAWRRPAVYSGRPPRRALASHYCPLQAGGRGRRYSGLRLILRDFTFIHLFIYLLFFFFLYHRKSCTFGLVLARWTLDSGAQFGCVGITLVVVWRHTFIKYGPALLRDASIPSPAPLSGT